MHEISIIYNREIIRISLLKKKFLFLHSQFNFDQFTNKEKKIYSSEKLKRKKKEIQVIITRHEMLNYLKLYSLYSLEGNSTKD